MPPDSTSNVRGNEPFDSAAELAALGFNIRNWTTCPECGRPAEITYRSSVDSTDGPIEHIRTFCMMGHAYYASVENIRIAQGKVLGDAS